MRRQRENKLDTSAEDITLSVAELGFVFSLRDWPGRRKKRRRRPAGVQKRRFNEHESGTVTDKEELGLSYQSVVFLYSRSLLAE